MTDPVFPQPPSLQDPQQGQPQYAAYPQQDQNQYASYPQPQYAVPQQQAPVFDPNQQGQRQSWHAEKGTSGIAITALVLGIISLVLSWIPIVNNAAAVLGVIGLIFGVIGIVKTGRNGRKKGRGLAVAGTVLSVLSIVISLGMQAAFSNAIDKAASAGGEAATSQIPAAKQKQSSSPSKPKAAVPAEYASALASAKSYSETMHMSKQGIYDQLVSPEADKFDPEAAKYAVDNLKADWNKNALESAKNYQSTMSMSSKAIHDQLTSEFDKFTSEQADYAIEHLND